MKERILYSALIVSLVTYGFWQSFPKGTFYYGNAIFILLLCWGIFLLLKKSFISFVLLCYSINNLADELFFTPGVCGWNELVFAIAVPVLWIIKTKWYARKISTE